jgi:lipopolysaccharide/colanic/teichoic acid biosynthesis glycosyltransferase
MFNNSYFTDHELILISDYLGGKQEVTSNVYRYHRPLNFSYDINKDLIKIRSLLSDNELLVISAETLEVKQRAIVDSSSNVIIFFIKKIYFFMFSRLFPRLPIFSYFYSKKVNKDYALSRSEFIGRAIWSGLDVISDYKLSNLHHIIVRKSSVSYIDEKPSYYPIILLKRVGLMGKIIKVHKLRTMHPYSEFIQEYIRLSNGTTIDGKIQNDYRITGMGLFLRKYWLDEVPQIIDILSGKIGIVGVRALSLAYFNRLPDCVKKKRVLVRPGLLPPVYADKAVFTDEDIVTSDLLYIDKISNSRFPVIINIQYAYQILKNIIMGARSR